MMDFKLLFCKNGVCAVYVKRYLFFLFVFIGALYFLAASLVDSIENQRYYGSMIKIVGKQQVLIQRVIYLAHHIIHCELRGDEYYFYEDSLQNTLQEFEQIHKSIKDQVSTFDYDSSIYVLYFGIVNLSYQIDNFIDSAYQFLENTDLEDRQDILEKMWLKWGEDSVSVQDDDEGTSDTLIMPPRIDEYLPVFESLSELLEMATLNTQLLGETHLAEVKDFALWVLLIFALLVGMNACLVVIPLLLLLNKDSKHSNKGA